jgi:hypothetical protein
LKRSFHRRMVDSQFVVGVVMGREEREREEED